MLSVLEKAGFYPADLPGGWTGLERLSVVLRQVDA